MTKHIPLFIIGSALFSSFLVAADQSVAAANEDGKSGQSQALQGSMASGEADPSFVPPPTTLISEPSQPQNAPTLEVRSVAATVIPPQVEQKPIPSISVTPPILGSTKTSSKETAIVTARFTVESPLPQPLYEPNQNGVIVLPGRTRASSEEGVSNPFDIRLIAFKPVNELKIRVGGVVNVVQVRHDALLLERDGIFVLIPRGREISIKIPL